jgi:hypothetical protein
VTTYPAIVVLDKTATPSGDAQIRYLALDDRMPDSIATEFERKSGTLPQVQLGVGSWRLESNESARLRDKLARGRPTLKEVYGAPLYGIKTGLNAAFVVDRATRDRLVTEDEHCAGLLKPFIDGENVCKWFVEDNHRWLIFIPKGQLDIDAYPSIKKHLLPFQHALLQRATKQAWYELQQGAVGNSTLFRQGRIVFPEISQGPKFVHIQEELYANKTVFSLPTDDAFLLGLLNSRLMWWQLRSVCSALRGGEWRLLLQAIYLNGLPIPKPSSKERSVVEALANRCQQAAASHQTVQKVFCNRVVTDLARAGGSAKLPTKLAAWPELDFSAFHAEVQKQFRHSIPLADRDAWQGRFEEDKARVAALTAQIADCERKIDEAVYALFSLTPEEIALIEKDLARGRAGGAGLIENS